MACYRKSTNFAAYFDIFAQPPSLNFERGRINKDDREEEKIGYQNGTSLGGCLVLSSSILFLTLYIWRIY